MDINRTYDLNEDEIDNIEESKDEKTLKAELFQYCKENNSEMVVKLLSNNVSPHYIDPISLWTPLHWSSIHGNASLVDMLIKKGGSQFYFDCVKRLGKLSLNQYRKQNQLALPLNEIQNKSTDVNDLVYQIKNMSLSKSKDDGSFSRIQSYDDNMGQSYDDNIVENEEMTPEKLLELNTDFTKNTPLLLASSKGYFETVCILLVDGYSSNDLDSYGNNALHLAAAAGDFQLVELLINDGANSNLVNIYKNLPIDLAKTKDIRSILSVAMVKYASISQTEICTMHDKTVTNYEKIIIDFNNGLKDVEVSLGDSSSNPTVNDTMNQINRLENKLQTVKEWKLNNNMIIQAETFLKYLYILKELIYVIKVTRESLPVLTQQEYNNKINILEDLVEQVEAIDSYPKCFQQFVTQAKSVILQGQMEYWLHVCITRIKDVECADDSNEYDINCLLVALNNVMGSKVPCSNKLLTDGTSLYNRLHAELEMTRAVKKIPIVRLPPVFDPRSDPTTHVIPRDYWQDCDIGKIIETVEFPNPPSNTNEYLWEPSEAYSSLSYSLEYLKRLYNSPDSKNANNIVLLKAKEKIIENEKYFKILELKNEEDKATAIEIATKKAKKLKRGKGKKKVAK